MSDTLIIKDESTNETKEFVATGSGYAQAAAYRNTIISSGHQVSDDGNSLGRLESIYPCPYNYN